SLHLARLPALPGNTLAQPAH
ncbi:hypothetical protein, partial [Pseudomonas aeruginosa]